MGIADKGARDASYTAINEVLDDRETLRKMQLENVRAFFADTAHLEEKYGLHEDEIYQKYKIEAEAAIENDDQEGLTRAIEGLDRRGSEMITDPDDRREFRDRLGDLIDANNSIMATERTFAEIKEEEIEARSIDRRIDEINDDREESLLDTAEDIVEKTNETSAQNFIEEQIIEGQQEQDKIADLFASLELDLEQSEGHQEASLSDVTQQNTPNLKPEDPGISLKT